MTFHIKLVGQLFLFPFFLKCMSHFLNVVPRSSLTTERKFKKTNDV